VVAEVTDGHSNHLRPEFLYRGFNFSQMVFGKHQVEHLDLMALVVQVPGDVGKPYRHRLGVHSALQSVVTVGGDQKDAHSVLLKSVAQIGPDVTGQLSTKPGRNSKGQPALSCLVRCGNLSGT